MSMRRSSLLASVAGAALAVGIGGISMPAYAGLNLGGYTGPIQIKFNDYEAFTGGTIAVSHSNFGIVVVTSITTPGGTDLWSQGGSNGIILGVFDDIHVVSVSGGSSTNTNGTFNFYQLLGTAAGYTSSVTGQGTGGYAAAGGTCAVNELCYNGISNAGGSEILTMNLVPGITSSITETLQATFTTTTNPGTGKASGYADVTGGTDASQFGKGGFKTVSPNAPADIYILDNFCAPATSTGNSCPQVSNWPLDSHDPVSANAIPEPASLALMGSALLGVGFVGWRSRKRG